MYSLFGKERHSRIRSLVNSPRHFEDNLPVLLGTLQMQWQSQAMTLTPVLSDGTNCFKYYHTKVEHGVKNVNTVLKHMADTRVEHIESDLDSSSFDNDDSSDDSEDSHYQKITRDIFGDSDSENNEVFEGFPIQMP